MRLIGQDHRTHRVRRDVPAAFPQRPGPQAGADVSEQPLRTLRQIHREKIGTRNEMRRYSVILDLRAFIANSVRRRDDGLRCASTHPTVPLILDLTLVPIHAMMASGVPGTAHSALPIQSRELAAAPVPIAASDILTHGAGTRVHTGFPHAGRFERLPVVILSLNYCHAGQLSPAQRKRSPARWYNASVKRDVSAGIDHGRSSYGTRHHTPAPVDLAHRRSVGKFKPALSILRLQSAGGVSSRAMPSTVQSRGDGRDTGLLRATTLDHHVAQKCTSTGRPRKTAKIDRLAAQPSVPQTGGAVQLPHEGLIDMHATPPPVAIGHRAANGGAWECGVIGWGLRHGC